MTAPSLPLWGAWRTHRPLWRAIWGARPETTTDVARRVLGTLDGLSALGGAFSDPWSILGDARAEVPTTVDGWADLLDASVDRDASGQTYPASGQHVSIATSGIDTPDRCRAELRIAAGSSVASPRRAVNHVELSVDGRAGHEAVHDLLSRQALELTGLLAEAWEPDAVELVDDRVVELYRSTLGRRSTWPRIGAVTWLHAAAYPAAVQAAPPGATVLREDEGVLVVAGSPDRIDADLAHLEALSRHLADSGVLGPIRVDQTGGATVHV